VVVVLTQTQPLLLSVQPFYIHRTSGTRNDRSFQLFDGFLGVAQGPKFDEGRAGEDSVLADELNVKDGAVLLEKLPDVLFLPVNRKVANVDDEFNLLSSEVLLRGDG
jgi:hypothetical protein